jgi:uncharacterized protein YutE (UPF0331/DUF86 family)
MTDPPLVEKKLAQIETYVAPLRDMAGFRNVLVHGYDTVNLDVVRDVVEHHLDDLLAFVRAIRAAVSGA